MLNLLFLILFSFPLPLSSSAEGANILVYGDTVQVTAEVNDEYGDLRAGAPIRGSVMITHNMDDAIDNDSFLIGDKPLKVEFVKSVRLSSYSNLIISIYHFQLDGMKAGEHVLPSIKVKVGGKNYESLSLTIQVVD